MAYIEGFCTRMVRSLLENTGALQPQQLLLAIQLLHAACFLCDDRATPTTTTDAMTATIAVTCRDLVR